jgi:hypothetical protein
MRSADRCQSVSRACRCKIRIKVFLVDSKLCEIARCEFPFLFCRAVRRNNEVRNTRDAGMLHRAGDRYPIGSYAMASRRLGPALVFGVVSVLAASMTSRPSGRRNVKARRRGIRELPPHLRPPMRRSARRLVPKRRMPNPTRWRIGNPVRAGSPPTRISGWAIGARAPTRNRAKSNRQAPRSIRSKAGPWPAFFTQCLRAKPRGRQAGDRLDLRVASIASPPLRRCSDRRVSSRQARF